MEQHKRDKRDGEQQCVVCGAPCKLNHYNVTACDACKQFFRRTVISQKLYQCAGEGNCKLKEKKAKCRGCRLDKCLVEGMSCWSLYGRELGPGERAFRELLNGRREQVKSGIPRIAPAAEVGICPVLGHLRFVESRSKLFLGTHLAFREGFLEQFGSLKELLQFGQNIMCNFDKFTALFPYTPIELSSATIPSKPLFAHKLNLQEFVEAIEFFRMAPIVGRLDPEDRLSLLRYVGLPLHHFGQFYRSHLRNSAVALDHNGGSPLHFMRKNQYYRANRIVQGLMERIFWRPMEPFNRVQLREEEYLLLRAIVVAHPGPFDTPRKAIPMDSAAPGLSRQAQLILQEESERLAAVLMGMLRAERGNEEGVRRYAELIHLVGVLVQVAAKNRCLVTYMTVFTDREHFEDKFPNGFKQLWDC